MTTSNAIFRISCQVQNYAWGKPGTASIVAKLGASGSVNPPLEIDPTTPYAELWIGTHPNGAATLYENPGITLLDAIRQQPGFLTAAIEARFKNDLPFLLKVLSVNKALSIQAHPDLVLAEALHQTQPGIYKDPNHKPEMCVALTPFEGLCGFKRANEICISMELYPEFTNLIGTEFCDKFINWSRTHHVASIASSTFSYPGSQRSSIVAEIESEQSALLRELFSRLMKVSEDQVSLQLNRLIKRLGGKRNIPTGSTDELLIRLNQQYPGDVGCFCVLILNYILLEPGQAMFLAANEPHAYLSGDCVECMATSDNVVRAGLTPKKKDVDTLINMLTYKTYEKRDIIMKAIPHPTDPHSTIFRAPVQEFSVMRTVLEAPGDQSKLPPVLGPSVVICIEGDGRITDSYNHSSHEFTNGCVFFVGSNTAVEIVATRGRCSLFRAFCEI